MEFKYKTVLVAVDGSDLSKKAFDRAIHIAKRDEAKLVLAHIVDTYNYSIIKSYLNDINEVYKQSEKDAEKMLQYYDQTAKEKGVSKIKRLIKFGTPKHVLIEEIIPEENIDLVVLGATGLRAADRVFLGSLSDYAFRHSKCDVLVVR